LVDEAFIQDLKTPVKEIEMYARSNFPTTLNAFLYGEERTHIITQVRITSDMGGDGSSKDLNGSKKELWVVKDDPRNKKWVFYCKTLFQLQITQNRKEEIERTHDIPYSNLWKYFGVDYESCDKSDIKMFISMLLDSMKLEMPTMSLKRTVNDDPDAEEEIHIKLTNIETICHARHIITVDEKSLPLTISLVGNDRLYFGIKAVTFNRQELSEHGIFLRVDSEEWKYDQEYINKLPRGKKKESLKYHYSLPQVLEEKGFAYIFRYLKFNKEQIPFVENVFGDITKIDVFTKQEMDKL